LAAMQPNSRTSRRYRDVDSITAQSLNHHDQSQTGCRTPAFETKARRIHCIFYTSQCSIGSVPALSSPAAQLHPTGSQTEPGQMTKANNQVV